MLGGRWVEGRKKWEEGRKKWEEWRGTYGFVIFKAVLVFVSFFAADDGAAEGFWFFAVDSGRRVCEAGHHLLFSDSSRELAVGSVLAGAESELGVLLRVVQTAAVGAEESFCGFVDAEIQHVIAVAIAKRSVVPLHELLVRAQLHVAYVADEVGVEGVEFGGCTGGR